MFISMNTPRDRGKDKDGGLRGIDIGKTGEV